MKGDGKGERGWLKKQREANLIKKEQG